jgi:hypothetical protein
MAAGPCHERAHGVCICRVISICILLIVNIQKLTPCVSLSLYIYACCPFPRIKLVVASYFSI